MKNGGREESMWYTELRRGHGPKPRSKSLNRNFRTFTAELAGREPIAGGRRAYTYIYLSAGGAPRHAGERRNLVIWNQSSAWRDSEAFRYPVYKAEESAPDKECVSYTHDRDYGVFK
eukprot:8048194-Pyramimonas_sp.AAC.1